MTLQKYMELKLNKPSVSMNNLKKIIQSTTATKSVLEMDKTRMNLPSTADNHSRKARSNLLSALNSPQMSMMLHYKSPSNP